VDPIVYKPDRYQKLTGIILLILPGAGLLLLKGIGNSAINVLLYIYSGGILWELVKVLRIKGDEPSLVIDNQGILDSALGVGIVDWHDIKSARTMLPYTASLDNKFRYVCVDLYWREKYIERLVLPRRILARIRNKLGLTEITLSRCFPMEESREVYKAIRNKIANRAGAV
jgi:hypothetical protein